jgi:hypothetical protein
MRYLDVSEPVTSLEAQQVLAAFLAQDDGIIDGAIVTLLGLHSDPAFSERALADARGLFVSIKENARRLQKALARLRDHTYGCWI